MAQDPIPGWTRSAEHAPRVLRVAELNRVARFVMEDQFRDVWVEGELADVSRPASGHVYFTLCDAEMPAQVRGVMYRNDASRARARLENGARVRLRCGLTIYEARGTFQLVARVALPAGEGDRAAEVARLKQKLASEGLFDPTRKRKLPRVPRVVGIVTSRDGAAIHDVVRVASARMGVRLVLAHCQVQGPDAPLSIVRAIRGIQHVPDLDVVIVARGGGASEDLSAYDDERVARAVASCRVPTVSGVGHEVDVTIVDLVADVRAATPSNAAEIVVPDAVQLRAELEGLERALARALDQRVQRERLRIERLLRRIHDPRRRIAAPRQSLAALHASLERSIARRLGDAHRALDRLRARLAVHEPRARLSRDRDRLVALEARLVRAMRARLDDARRTIVDHDRRVRALGPAMVRTPRERLARLVGTLDALSPLGILARGYAIALHQPSGAALVRARDAAPGDRVSIRVHEGTIETVVERVRDEEDA
ncbi:exodeoxyribonuclease VII large subunit [Sandaracinus amylolyticus]|uniref:exodeoxyribonuclease VII large subunit n=1 Tax=Sandaracinus amylolyticus TaxID=927083 RepID=UPI0009462066|nr:exodeoxyribonuclease VII large subunit [Sandaracinus amylolyticus]